MWKTKYKAFFMLLSRLVKRSQLNQMKFNFEEDHYYFILFFCLDAQMKFQSHRANMLKIIIYDLTGTAKCITYLYDFFKNWKKTNKTCP